MGKPRNKEADEKVRRDHENDVFIKNTAKDLGVVKSAVSNRRGRLGLISKRSRQRKK